MKRFLIAAATVALVAPTLAAASFAQDFDRGGRGRGGDGQSFQGRGGGNFDRGDRGDRGQGGGGGFDRGGRGGGRNFGNPQAAPQPQAVQPQAAPPAPQQAQPQFQRRGERGQFQGGGRNFGGGQFQGRQFQGGQPNVQPNIQAQPNFQQRQFQGQRQVQGGQPNVQGRRDFGDRGQFQNRRFDNRQGFAGAPNRFDNRGGYDNRRFDNRFNERRYTGPAPRGGTRFSYNGRDFYRFRSTPYVWPRGYNYGPSYRWSLYSILPSIFLNQGYYIDPYQYGLPWADPGFQWIQVGNDALLVDVYTGEIVDIVPGVFYW